jgi:protein-S-isoprenylcysteine O-methyltransferase Ste14
MSDSHSGVPNVKVIPPLVYFAAVVIGIVISIWIPTKIVPSSLAWMLGGLLIVCGAVLTGSAILKFKGVGTTVRPDRAASTLVVVGPYRITRMQ